MIITGLILLIALGILAWGLYRALPYGKVGILAWLQSVVLMVPWLLFFGLVAVGIYLNLAGVLVLLLSSTVIYILIGRQLRQTGQAELLAQRLAAFTEAKDAADSAATDEPAPDEFRSPTSSPETPTSANEGDRAQPLAAASDRQTQPAAEGSDSPKTPELPEIQPIPAEDLTTIRGIFGIDTFFATETIPYQDGAIFRGNLRGNPQEVQPALSALLEARLADRYRLFLVEGADSRPVVIILPQRNAPQPLTSVQKFIAVGLAIATVATVLETVSLLLGFDLFTDPSRMMEALPLGLSVVAILVAHEVAHWVLAQRYQVKLSWPFFIPAIQIGSFGALTRFEDFLPNRTVLFDIAFAGPAAGGLLSLAMMVIGLTLSHPGSLFQLPVEFFQGSVLVGTLAKVVLGDALQTPLVDIHPLTIVGWLGLVITALNLMPAGQLDGGRIVQAIYGRKVAQRATIATLIVLGIVSFVNPIALYWLILILFLQRNLERPSQEELSEPDDARAALALLALFLAVSTLIPLTPSLAGRLGIGG